MKVGVNIVRNMKMRKVAKQIIFHKIDKEILSKMRSDFFQIMRENGIRQGEHTKNGTVIANFEWTMCKNLYLDTIRNSLDILFLFDIPEDLSNYYHKPAKSGQDGA